MNQSINQSTWSRPKHWHYSDNDDIFTGILRARLRLYAEEGRVCFLYWYHSVYMWWMYCTPFVEVYHPWIFTPSMDKRISSSARFTRLVAGGSTNLKKIYGSRDTIHGWGYWSIDCATPLIVICTITWSAPPAQYLANTWSTTLHIYCRDVSVRRWCTFGIIR